MCQDWYANEVLKQLARGVEPQYVKVNIRLTNTKPAQPNQIIQAYHYLESSKNIFRGSRKLKQLNQ